MCFLFFHKWGKWYTKYNVKTDISNFPTTVQDRVCERCGKLVWRYV